MLGEGQGDREDQGLEPVNELLERRLVAGASGGHEIRGGASRRLVERAASALETAVRRAEGDALRSHRSWGGPNVAYRPGGPELI